MSGSIFGSGGSIFGTGSVLSSIFGGGGLPIPTLTIRDTMTASTLPPGVTFSRASGAVRVNAAGDYEEVGPGVLRQQHDLNGNRLGLLIEKAASTNQNTNPRTEGAVPGVLGSGGALPTGWSGFTSNLPAGSVTVVRNETRRGVDGVVLKISGVPTGTTANNNWIDVSEMVSIGTDVAVGVYVELLAGSLSNVASFSLRIGNEPTATFFTPGAFARVETVRVLTGTASRTGLRWFYNNTSDPVDFTIWIGWPTREHAADVSSPILPPVGTPGVSTRAADVLDIPDLDGSVLSFVMRFAPTNSSASGTALLLSQSGSADDSYAVTLASGTPSMTKTVGASGTAAFARGSALTASTFATGAFAIGGGSADGAWDGTLGTTDTSTGTDLGTLTDNSVGGSVGIILKFLQIYSGRRLTAQQVEAASKRTVV